MFRSRLTLSILLAGNLVGCGPDAANPAAEGGRVSLFQRLTAEPGDPGWAYAYADFFTPVGTYDSTPLATADPPCSQPLAPPAERDFLYAGDFVALVGPAGPIVLATNGGGGYSTDFDPSLLVPEADYDIEISGSSLDDGIAAASLPPALHVPSPVQFIEPDFSTGTFPLSSGESVRIAWEPLSPPECVLVSTGCSHPPPVTPPGGGTVQTSTGSARMTEDSSVVLTATVSSGGTCAVSVSRQVERHVPLTADAYVVTMGTVTLRGTFAIH